MRLQTRVWPVQSLDQYALPQSGIAGQSLKLIGTNLGAFPIIDYGVRTVSLTSAFDLSDVSFTINGFAYGQPLSETIAAGPDGDTVESTLFFDEIVAIVPSITFMPLIKAGTGTTGYIYPFTVSSQIASFGVTAEAHLDAGATTYNVYTSIFKANKTAPAIGANTDHFEDAPFPGFATDATASDQASLTNPIQMVTFKINASNADSVVTASVLQSGIT